MNAENAIRDLFQEEVFVFGSNLGGIHGGGSAKHAHEKHGAMWGVGVGMTGKSYAIPTKAAIGNRVGEVLSLPIIEAYVKQFLEYAKLTPFNVYNVVPIGCGLAGFTMEQIAPMFANAPVNVKYTDPNFEEIVLTSSIPNDQEEEKVA